MARYKFSSVFADEIMQYIKDKTVAGYNGENFRSMLIGFDKFCIEYNLTEPAFTVCHASKWLEKKECESHTTHYSRINGIKHFLIYLSIKGYDVYITRDVKFKGTDFSLISIQMKKVTDILWQLTTIVAARIVKM